MAQTPIDYLNSLPVANRRELAGRFTNILPNSLYINLSFSNVEKIDINALGVANYGDFFFQSTLLNNAGVGILSDIVGQGQQIPQCLDADINAVIQRAQNLKKHCTFSFSNSEMTRRALVDEVVQYAVKVSQSAFNTLVVFGEEYQYDISKVNGNSRGVAVIKPPMNSTYVLTGPIDYVLVSVNNATALANKGQGAWTAQHLMNARVAVCPIEVKAEFGGLTELYNHGICQAWAQAFVVGEAWGPKDYRPFVLTDGNIWIFGVIKKSQNPKWFHTSIKWDMNADNLRLIVQTLVCWMCFPSAQVWQHIENKRVATNQIGFTAKHTFN